MKTRRDFLRTASVVPLAGLLEGPSLLLSGGAGQSAGEPIYAGKPMSYWLSTLTSEDYDRDVYDLGDQWMFRHFGDAAVPGLIEAMRNDFWSSAETELEMIGSPATVRALTQALKDEDPRVRIGSAATMYGIGLYKPRFRPEMIPAFREAFPVLAEVLKTDEEPRVAQMAGWILFEFAPKMDPTFLLPVKISDYENAGFWAQLVRRFPKHFQAEEVVPLLVARLGDEDARVRLEVAQALSNYDPDHPGIVPVFVEYATEREHITALEFSRLDRIAPKALPALREALRNENPRVRTSILHAVGWSGSPAVVPTLAEGLDDESSEVRCQAVSSLYFADPLLAVPLVIRALHDGSRHVRNSARWALRNDSRLALAVLPEVIGLLEKADPVVRASAALALRDLEKETERALATLRRNLDHDDLCVRLEAAIAVAEMEPEGSDLVPVLADGIDCKEHDLRAGAIEGLRQAGRNAKVVLPKIIEGLDNSWERSKLIGILAELGPDAAAAMPRLFAMMEDPEAGSGVPFALGKIGPKAIPPLMEAIRDRDLLIRSRAIRALGHMGDLAERFVPMFIGFLRNNSPVLRIAASDALGCIGPEATAALPALKEVSEDRDIAVRISAQAAVGRIERSSTA